MTDAPTAVVDAQLVDVHVRVALPEKKAVEISAETPAETP
jgi:hypothetical protein